jgi:hypothetical protein
MPRKRPPRYTLDPKPPYEVGPLLPSDVSSSRQQLLMPSDRLPTRTVDLPRAVVDAWEAFCTRQGLDETEALAELMQAHMRAVEEQ